MSTKSSIYCNSETGLHIYEEMLDDDSVYLEIDNPIYATASFLNEVGGVRCSSMNIRLMSAEEWKEFIRVLIEKGLQNEDRT